MGNLQLLSRVAAQRSCHSCWDTASSRVTDTRHPASVASADTRSKLANSILGSSRRRERSSPEPEPDTRAHARVLTLTHSQKKTEQINNSNPRRRSHAGALHRARERFQRGETRSLSACRPGGGKGEPPFSLCQLGKKLCRGHSPLPRNKGGETGKEKGKQPIPLPKKVEEKKEKSPPPPKKS